MIYFYPTSMRDVCAADTSYRKCSSWKVIVNQITWHHSPEDSRTNPKISQICSFLWNGYTGHFIMFSVIKNIYNKKTKGPTLMEFFTATGRLKKFFFWQPEMFDVCTTGDTSNISSCQKKLFQFSCGCEQFH